MTHRWCAQPSPGTTHASHHHVYAQWGAILNVSADGCDRARTTSCVAPLPLNIVGSARRRVARRPYRGRTCVPCVCVGAPSTTPPAAMALSTLHCHMYKGPVPSPRMGCVVCDQTLWVTSTCDNTPDDTHVFVTRTCTEHPNHPLCVWIGLSCAVHGATCVARDRQSRDRCRSGFCTRGLQRAKPTRTPYAIELCGV